MTEGCLGIAEDNRNAGEISILLRLRVDDLQRSSSCSRC